MVQLAGRVAVITGGARGMGAAHAALFLREGARVVVTDVLEEEGAALVREMGEGARFLRHDVTDGDRWHEVVAQVEEAFGPVTILVNNAGVAFEPAFDDITAEQFRRVVDINLTGAFLGMKAVVPSMRRAGGGSIVNISSIAGFIGAEVMAYTASKWALRGLTKSAAVNFARDGIRVNAVYPGYIRTPMTDNFTEEAEEAALAGIPLGRFADPLEVSKLVLHLASDDSSYTTGSDFVVDGGAIAR